MADRGERGGQHHALDTGVARRAQHPERAFTRRHDQFVLVLRERSLETARLQKRAHVALTHEVSYRGVHLMARGQELQDGVAADEA